MTTRVKDTPSLEHPWQQEAFRTRLRSMGMDLNENGIVRVLGRLIEPADLGWLAREYVKRSVRSHRHYKFCKGDIYNLIPGKYGSRVEFLRTEVLQGRYLGAEEQLTPSGYTILKGMAAEFSTCGRVTRVFPREVRDTWIPWWVFEHASGLEKEDPCAAMTALQAYKSARPRIGMEEFRERYPRPGKHSKGRGEECSESQLLDSDVAWVQNEANLAALPPGIANALRAMVEGWV
jgi:hypothetical protein